MQKKFGAALWLLPWAILSLKAQHRGSGGDTLGQKPIQLNEVFITGDTRTDAVLYRVANDQDKRIVQPKNISDLFQDILGFSVIKRGSYAMDPTFRGTQYEQLNLQFNGGTKIMHACPNRMDPITTHVIPEEIERIEIIKGPFSVRYGATFGGLVNLVSRPVGNESSGYHGKVNLGGESNGNGFTTQVGITRDKGPLDWALNIGYRDFGNYEDGSGMEVPSSFTSTDYGLQLGWEPGNTQRFQIGWRQSFGRDVLHAGLPMDTDKDDSGILSLDYKYQPTHQNWNALNVKLYRSKVDHVMHNRYRPSFNSVEAVSPVEATTWGGRTEIQWKPWDKTLFFMGMDLFAVSREGVRQRLVKTDMNGDLLPEPLSLADQIWQGASIYDYGWFLEGRYFLADRLILVPGIRYDFVRSRASAPADDFLSLYPDLDVATDNNVSGHLALKYALSENTLVEVALGRGVRSANMIERYINHFTVGQDPYEYVGNPELRAEANHQIEVGLQGEFHTKDSFIEGWSYEISAFYSDYQDYIIGVIDPSLPKKFMPMAEPREVKRFMNLRDASKSGFETRISVDFLRRFSLGTSWAYVHSRNGDLAESLPLTPPFSGRLNLSYTSKAIWARADFTVTATQENIAPSFGEQSTPGYQVFDLRLGTKAFTHMSIGVAALNVFDASYASHLNFSFVNQTGLPRERIKDPGANISLFLQYEF